MFGWEWKNGRIEKVSMYKFTHIPLLKNDSQLKQKSDKQPKINKSPKLLKIKNHVQKKSCLVKTKKKKKQKTKKNKNKTKKEEEEEEEGGNT